MGHPGDDDVTDRHTFDPGVETGYLRRSTRDHPLDPELGAAPFEPGAGAGYDDRRARKAAKRREREERELREKERRELEEEQRRQAAVFARRPSQAPAAAAAAAAPALEPEPAEVEPAPEIELAPEPAPVTELPRLKPAKPSLAERLERERAERAEAERERRAQVERERAEREREEREKRERRRRDRDERLRRDREALRKRRPQRKRRRRPDVKPTAAEAGSTTARARAKSAQRAAHPVRVTRPHPLRHRELVWPTAKAGLAVTVVLAVAAALGSMVGLPVPGLNASAGRNSVLNSAALFGVDAGTPQGLAGGFVFPIGAPPPHNYGEAPAKFGAARSGHVHEGQDVFARPGTPLMAVHDGVVADGGGGKSFYAYGGGNSFVMYSPTDNRSYVYLHMLHPSPLHAGDQVHAGQLIGQVGCTGSCDGPHLHFEIREGKVAYGHEGKPVDPLPYLRQWEQLGMQG